jgi:hypothetical protein
MERQIDEKNMLNFDILFTGNNRSGSQLVAVCRREDANARQSS